MVESGARPSRTRLSEEETERRMLETAIRIVVERGLPVSLDPLGFEDLIKQAGVSRTAVYRKWRNRDDFYQRLLVELVDRTRHGMSGFASASAARVSAILTSPTDWSRTLEGRRATFVEACRLLADAHVDVPGIEAQIRAMVGMLAVMNTPDAPDDVVAALRRSEARFQEVTMSVYRRIAGRTGFRPRPGVDWALIASMTGAFMVGAAVQHAGNPVLQAPPRTGDPFGVGHEAPWSAVATGFAALMIALTQPDPDFAPEAAAAPAG